MGLLLETAPPSRPVEAHGTPVRECMGDPLNRLFAYPMIVVQKADYFGCFVLLLRKPSSFFIRH